MTSHSTPMLVPYSCFGFRPSAIPQEGAQQAPTFRPMFIVAKRPPISATAEHLSPLYSASRIKGAVNDNIRI